MEGRLGLHRVDSLLLVDGNEERVPVGYVRRAHGIRGEVIVRPLTDEPDRRFSPGSRLSTDEDPPRTLEVVTRRTHRDGLIVGFADTESRSDAEGLQGLTLTIARKERRPLADGEFWPEDLENLAVINSRGEHLGKVVAVILGEAQDRLVVETGAGERVEVPFVPSIVGEIHPSGGFLVVDAPKGLFDGVD